MKGKVVFKDGTGETKVAVGYIIFELGFIRVLDDRGNSIFVNNDNVVLIEDLMEGW